MKSPKTTVLGILTAITAVSAAVKAMMDGDPTTNPDWPTVIASITTGLGLVFARDNNKTSEQAGAVPPK